MSGIIVDFVPEPAGREGASWLVGRMVAARAVQDVGIKDQAIAGGEFRGINFVVFAIFVDGRRPGERRVSHVGIVVRRDGFEPFRPSMRADDELQPTGS